MGIEQPGRARRPQQRPGRQRTRAFVISAANDDGVWRMWDVLGVYGVVRTFRANA